MGKRKEGENENDRNMTLKSEIGSYFNINFTNVIIITGFVIEKF